jgi:3-hydroxyisobutyrate dehydrogenase-like beta-hydroxyacid dehydrogenase
VGQALTVGVVGVGQIGARIVSQLCAAGHPVLGYDADPGALGRLDERAVRASSPAEVADSCDVVLIAVATAAQADAVLRGPDGMLRGTREGMLAGLISTISVSDFDLVREAALRGGTTLIDCPVTGGSAAADRGQLVCLAGGTSADIAVLTPAVEPWTTRLLHMGPAGSGLKAKLARNLITYGTMAAVSEAAVLAMLAGVELGMLAEAVQASDELTGGTAARLLEISRRWTAGPDSDVTAKARIALARKDLAAARELSAQLVFQTPVVDVAEALIEAMFGWPEELARGTRRVEELT